MPHKLQLRVIHVSGQDDSFRAVELNTHSPLTKGWHASKFCLYPQDIIMKLDNRSRIRKIQILSHQYLVATKIEFYVGDVPEDLSLAADNAKYTRLGYISLSDNEKTGFKARELKSVHVDAVGCFVKLVIHKNHVNKHNIYNQVGIVAMNVIGDELHKPSDLTDPDYYLDAKRQRAILGVDPVFEGPDYISPLDDLAFDMYQDPDIANIIRKLEKKKQEAVLQERFDFAKKLKTAIANLQKAGEKLGKYEVEKRQAVENEDYDKAKLKKVQMEEYRVQVHKDLNLPELLELSGSRHPQHVDLEPIRQPTPTRLPELRSPPRTPPTGMPYDERPLPAMKNKEPSTSSQSSPPRVRTPYDERQLPVVSQKPPERKESISGPPAVQEEEDTADDANVGITGEPEPMTEKDLREAAPAIDVYGISLVSKAYSKIWSYREDALLAVLEQMKALPSGSPKEEIRGTMKAAIFLINRALKDKVYGVFKAGLNVLEYTQNTYCPSHKLSRADFAYTAEKTLPNLLHRTGDTAARARDHAKKFTMEMAKFKDIKPTNVVPHECVKPIKQNMAPRLALSRVEIVENLYKDLGIQGNTGLNVDNVMNFCVVALGHHSGEVREAAERIIKTLYKEVGQPVKDYLPPDDDKTRKITLYRQLFEAFDKMDGKPSKSDVKRQKAQEEAKKQQEIEALQLQLQQLKDMAAGKQPVDDGLLQKENKKPAKKKTEPKKTSKLNKPKEDDDASMYNMDNICIFCGEKNESFTEEGLDLHYWKQCPMLKRCTNCKQVVEIASYTEHLLTECEAKDNYVKCPRCTEAIPKAEYEEHRNAASCKEAVTGQNHCPLCHENIPLGEDGWKNHLMKPNGCKNNPRRPVGASKQALGGAKGRTKAGTKKTPR